MILNAAAHERCLVQGRKKWEEQENKNCQFIHGDTVTERQMHNMSSQKQYPIQSGYFMVYVCDVVCVWRVYVPYSSSM